MRLISRPTKSSTALQYYRIKPELGNTIVAFHMNMSRLIAIARVEEKPVWSNDHHCGHLPYPSMSRTWRIRRGAFAPSAVRAG